MQKIHSLVYLKSCVFHLWATVDTRFVISLSKSWVILCLPSQFSTQNTFYHSLNNGQKAPVMCFRSVTIGVSMFHTIAPCSSQKKFRETQCSDPKSVLHFISKTREIRPSDTEWTAAVQLWSLFFTVINDHSDLLRKRPASKPSSCYDTSVSSTVRIGTYVGHMLRQLAADKMVRSVIQCEVYHVASLSKSHCNLKTSEQRYQNQFKEGDTCLHVHFVRKLRCAMTMTMPTFF